MIVVDHLAKRFSVPKKSEGRLALFRSIFAREYATIDAVADVSFTVAPGERVGFLGPNGAGKTTTLKMLAGLLVPTAGTVRVGAFRPEDRDPEFLREIALVLGQKQQLIWDLPPEETFVLQKALFDLDDRFYREALDRLVTLLAIGDAMKRPTRQLSLGERMKCELCCALLHGPKYLFLDEPTVGLDVAMQEAVRAFVKRYNEETGATLLLTSHYMADVEALCPRIIVIDGGRVVWDGDREALVRRVRPVKTITLRFSQTVTRSAVEGLAAGHLCDPAEGELREVTMEVPEAEVKERLQLLLAALPVKDLVVADPPFERVLQELLNAPLEAGGDRNGKGQ